jgi:hypothetical protein
MKLANAARAYIMTALQGLDGLGTESGLVVARVVKTAPQLEAARISEYFR